MKNILNSILILASCTMFSQHGIDTTEIKSIRYEWKINPKTKDTTLNTKLIEYKSGFYLNKIEFLKDSSKFGHFFIYKSKKRSILRRTLIENYVNGMGNGIIRTYYDKYQNADSVVTSIYEPELRRVFVPIEKRYKREGKLDYITDLDGMNVYKYNVFGKLKRVEQFQDTILYKISNFKKDLLISETFPTRKKYRTKFTYEYDKKGRLIVKDDDDHYLFKYYYNNFGLERVDKIYKEKNQITEYTKFNYDNTGVLVSKKEFNRKNRLRQEYIYKYK